MIKTTIKDIELLFETSPSLFSPHHIDLGTLSMLECVDFKKGDKVLDLGCGYGVVGILAAKIVGDENVVMVDNDEEAIRCAQRNIQINNVQKIKIIKSDGFDNLEETDFTKILVNPPYHVDFSVPKIFVHKGFNRLKIGGEFWMVTKRRLWYKNKLIGIFGGVKIVESRGYYVFMAMKNQATYAKKLDPYVINSTKKSRQKQKSRVTEPG